MKWRKDTRDSQHEVDTIFQSIPVKCNLFSELFTNPGAHLPTTAAALGGAEHAHDALLLAQQCGVVRH
eukprot:7685378-Pyramimonas_sp.AAC.1